MPGRREGLPGVVPETPTLPGRVRPPLWLSVETEGSIGDVGERGWVKGNTERVPLDVSWWLSLDPFDTGED